MKSKNIQNKLPQKESLELLNTEGYCDVSKASVELMLERVCNGKEIDFPFSK